MPQITPRTVLTPGEEADHGAIHETIPPTSPQHRRTTGFGTGGSGAPGNTCST